MKIGGGGFNGDAHLADAAPCGGNGRKILDVQRAFGADLVAAAIGALAREDDCKFIADAENEIILHSAHGRCGIGGSVDLALCVAARHAEHVVAVLAELIDDAAGIHLLDAGGLRLGCFSSARVFCGCVFIFLGF